MQSKRKPIFGTKATEVINQATNPTPETLIPAINPDPQAILLKNATLRQGNIFRKNKVYRRGSSANPNSSKYTYQVPSHVHMQGSMLDCCCQIMGCNIVDVS